MKKRILSIFLCGTMCVSLLTGCGGTKEPSTSGDGEKKETKTEVVKGGNMSFAIGGALEAKSDNVPPLFRRYVFVGKEVKL